MSGYTGHGTTSANEINFCYESCLWCRIARSSCWPAVQRTTTVRTTDVPAMWNKTLYHNTMVITHKEPFLIGSIYYHNAIQLWSLCLSHFLHQRVITAACFALSVRLCCYLRLKGVFHCTNECNFLTHSVKKDCVNKDCVYYQQKTCFHKVCFTCVPLIIICGPLLWTILTVNWYLIELRISFFHDICSQGVQPFHQ